MVVNDESNTYKTCGYCGIINDKPGGSKAFKCKQEKCQQKSICNDRDIHTARYILLLYLTHSNIEVRVCYLEPAE